jgi:hypothetical protein
MGHLFMNREGVIVTVKRDSKTIPFIVRKLHNGEYTLISLFSGNDLSLNSADAEETIESYVRTQTDEYLSVISLYEDIDVYIASVK